MTRFRYNNGRFEHTWTFTSAGVAVDISGSTFAAVIRNRRTKAIPAFTFTLTQPGGTGQLKAEITAANMQSLSGEYEFDILEKDIAGNIYHLHYGTIEVKDGVTVVAGATWQ